MLEAVFPPYVDVVYDLLSNNFCLFDFAEIPNLKIAQGYRLAPFAAELYRHHMLFCFGVVYPLFKP